MKTDLHISMYVTFTLDIIKKSRYKKKNGAANKPLELLCVLLYHGPT